MLHGPEKRRQIARSVLPSTRRKSARDDLNKVRRRNRRTINQDLYAIARAHRAGAVVEAYDSASANLRAYPNADIRSAVSRRRDGDKLGPLLRWARDTTRHLPVEDRLDSVRRMFDDNLIGRHALSHLERDRHFLVIHEHERHWYTRLDQGRRRGRGDQTSRLRAAGLDAVERGDHAALNRWMKAHPTGKGAVLVLAGLHDVDAFAAHCDRNLSWRRALESFSSDHRARQFGGRNVRDVTTLVQPAGGTVRT